MHTKNEIITALTEAHEHFCNYISGLTTIELESKLDEKWTAAQQVAHIFKSVDPLARGLILPKFMIRLIWGKANRNSKTYDLLIQKYLGKLQQGGRASSPFVPKEINAGAVPFWSKKITNAIITLIKRLENFTEEDFDFYILPHPLLGKITLREMMFFTVYHVQHHGEIIKRDLKLLHYSEAK